MGIAPLHPSYRLDQYRDEKANRGDETPPHAGLVCAI